MKKTILTIALSLSAILAFSQQSKQVKQPNTQQKEVKAVDSTKITITVTLEQYNQIQAILTQASNLIGQSNVPYKEGSQTVQALGAVIGFFKQYEPKLKK